MPPALVEGFRTLLKGGAAVARIEEAFDIVRSRPHGAVAAVLGTLIRLRLDRLIAPRRSPERDRAVAMIVTRDGDGFFGYGRNAESIAAEAALDGLCVIRTSLPEAELVPQATVRAYKRLSAVERAFRSLKSVDLKVRPVFHRTEERVRAHVLLCMLAYYVEWDMRKRLAPLLFDDEDTAAAEAARPSVVAPARVSESAQRKAARKRNGDGRPVHSLRTLLRDLATVTENRVAPRLPGAESFDILARPTELQREAFRLLRVRLQ